MAVRTHRRRALLLLVALALPCLVLVAFGVRTIRQGGELVANRLADDKRRLIGQVGRELSVRLERIKNDENAAVSATLHRGALGRPQDPIVAMVGVVREERLLLPWDVDPNAQMFTSLMDGTPAGRTIDEGERQELAQQLEAADLSYRRAGQLSVEPAQADYADLHRARVQEKTGHSNEARRLREALVGSPVVDDQGVPLACYAAAALLDAGAGANRVVDFVDRQLKQNTWMSPPAAYCARDLIDRLVTTAPDDRVLASVRGIQAELVTQIGRAHV